jgi:hypothetical protein
MNDTSSKRRNNFKERSSGKSSSSSSGKPQPPDHVSASETSRKRARSDTGNCASKSTGSSNVPLKHEKSVQGHPHSAAPISQSTAKAYPSSSNRQLPHPPPTPPTAQQLSNTNQTPIVSPTSNPYMPTRSATPRFAPTSGGVYYNRPNGPVIPSLFLPPPPTSLPLPPSWSPINLMMPSLRSVYPHRNAAPIRIQSLDNGLNYWPTGLPVPWSNRLPVRPPYPYRPRAPQARPPSNSQPHR